MRLDKYLTTVTNLTRAECRRVLKSSTVTVDGLRVTDPSIHVDQRAEVAIDGEVLRTAIARYFMLNKPSGYVSATKDREHLTVLEWFDEDNLDKLHIAGRLDIDTTGLLLLTDDGQWSHKITSPKHKCEKTYRVWLVDAIQADYVEKFAQGIELRNEREPTLPARLEVVNEAENEVLLSIAEGK